MWIKEDWVIDTTYSDGVQQGSIKFIRIDTDLKILNRNSSCWSKNCPGNLVGIINFKGVEELNAWILNNPGWFIKYANNFKKKFI